MKIRPYFDSEALALCAGFVAPALPCDGNASGMQAVAGLSSFVAAEKTDPGRKGGKK